MYAAFIRLAADCLHRVLCAWTTDAIRREAAAARCNASWDAWAAAGLPCRRVLWFAAWTTHYALLPLRWIRRTAGR
jgi:hypothetical protein